MIPVLHGVWASVGSEPVGFDHLETITVGSGGAASITFSSIPGTYKHLQVRLIARSTASLTGGDYIAVSTNVGSGNYYHNLFGDGASATSSAASGLAVAQRYASASDSASIFGAMVIDLLDYASTTKNKTLRNLGGYDANGSGRIYLNSSLWTSTTAITSLTLAGGSGNFAQYSSFSLYGVK